MVVPDHGDGTARLWNVEDGKLSRTYNNFSKIDSIAFCPDGRIMATGSEDGTVILREVKSWEILSRFNARGRYGLRSVIFSLDSRFVAPGY